MLLGLAHRFDRVLLDASNLDVRGRVNSSLIGPSERPKVRLPGGGGAPDVAARARELVWLSGGPGLDRLQSPVEHVTAAPGPDTLVRVHTRWGSCGWASTRGSRSWPKSPASTTSPASRGPRRRHVDLDDPPVAAERERAAATEL